MTISTFQFNEMQRRCMPREVPPSGVVAFDGRESEIHQEIEAELKRRRWLYFHGATSFKTRRTLGEPDFQIYGSRGRFWLVEVKTAKGKLSIEQMAVALMAESLNHKVHTVRSFADFINIVDNPTAAVKLNE